MTFLPYALDFALLCYGLAVVLTLLRLLRGPDVLDRVLALDTLTINAIALTVLWGIRTGNGLVFEAALLFAMTGFVGTVAYARYILRGDIIE